jgi:hypothetical protein
VHLFLNTTKNPRKSSGEILVKIFTKTYLELTIFHDFLEEKRMTDLFNAGMLRQIISEGSTQKCQQKHGQNQHSNFYQKNHQVL